jgi:AcrR family transcriptional regulator
MSRSVRKERCLAKPKPETDTSPWPTQSEKIEEREKKRRAVLIAAVKMFNERGFHATSLDDVAQTLGISKPTIYHYLGNKDQVLLECLRHGLQQVQDAANNASGTSGRGIDRLRAYLRSYATVNMNDFGRCVNRTSDEILSESSLRQVKELKSKIDHAMRALIMEGMADGSILPGDVKLIAFTLAGALNWPARWHNPSGPLSIAALAESMVSILTKGIEAKP